MSSHHLNTCLDAARTVARHYHRPSTRPATTHCAKPSPARPAQSSPLSTDNIGAPAPPRPNLSVNSPVPGRGRNPGIRAARRCKLPHTSIPERTERQASFSSLKPRSAQVSGHRCDGTRRKKPYSRIYCYHQVTCAEHSFGRGTALEVDLHSPKHSRSQEKHSRTTDCEPVSQLCLRVLLPSTPPSLDFSGLIASFKPRNASQKSTSLQHLNATASHLEHLTSSCKPYHCRAAHAHPAHYAPRQPQTHTHTPLPSTA